MNDDIIIEVKNLSHRFPNGTLGVDQVNLAVRKGEFVIVAGPNGSGKTTLLRHFNGLVRPSEGAVLVKGVPVGENLLRARKLVGMVFQEADSQIVGETVKEDVAFGPGNLGMDALTVERLAASAVTRVGLDHLKDVLPHLLSGGEKRRLAVAGILSMQPEIIVFDEPFSNLDYPGICQVAEQMRSLHAEGCTIVVSSHDLDPVIDLAGRLVIMANGRIVRDGPAVLPGKEAVAFGIRPINGWGFHV